MSSYNNVDLYIFISSLVAVVLLLTKHYVTAGQPIRTLPKPGIYPIAASCTDPGKDYVFLFVGRKSCHIDETGERKTRAYILPKRIFTGQIPKYPDQLIVQIQAGKVEVILSSPSYL